MPKYIKQLESIERILNSRFMTKAEIAAKEAMEKAIESESKPIKLSPKSKPIIFEQVDNNKNVDFPSQEYFDDLKKVLHHSDTNSRLSHENAPWETIGDVPENYWNKEEEYEDFYDRWGVDPKGLGVINYGQGNEGRVDRVKSTVNDFMQQLYSRSGQDRIRKTLMESGKTSEEADKFINEAINDLEHTNTILYDTDRTPIPDLDGEFIKGNIPYRGTGEVLLGNRKDDMGNPGFVKTYNNFINSDASGISWPYYPVIGVKDSSLNTTWHELYHRLRLDSMYEPVLRNDPNVSTEDLWGGMSKYWRDGYPNKESIYKEMGAVIGALRREYGLAPGEQVSEEKIKQMMQHSRKRSFFYKENPNGEDHYAPAILKYFNKYMMLTGIAAGVGGGGLIARNDNQQY